MKKIYPDAKAALAGLLHDGITIMAGGFGLSGIPEKLIAEVKQVFHGEPDYTISA